MMAGKGRGDIENYKQSKGTGFSTSASMKGRNMMVGKGKSDLEHYKHIGVADDDDDDDDDDHDDE